MEEYRRRKQYIAIGVNCIQVLVVAVIAGMGVAFGAGEGQVGQDVRGLAYFMPFTIDSNILSGISALVMVIFGIRSLRAGTEQTPRWAVVLHLMAATSLLLTFLIVALFLVPMAAMQGKPALVYFENDMFFFHLLNPALTICSFVCLHRLQYFRKGACLLGAVPVFLYSIVYLLMVVVFRKWDDFYGFTFGGHNQVIPLVLFVLYALVLLLSLLLIRWHNHGLCTGPRKS